MRSLGYRPALDGVRALAIIPVVSLHAFGWPRQGALGVDLFFVLSGFLITTLLVQEHQGTGAISLRQFYVRRIRRLFPALATMLVAYAAFSLAQGRHPLLGVLIGGSYAANIVIASGLHVIPAGLSHLWSLAAEEQFYVIWPVLLVFLLRRFPAAIQRTLGVLIFAVIIDRLVLAASGAPLLTRIYTGPDAHADPLLVGCLFGVLFTRGLILRSTQRRDRDRIGWLALAFVGVGVLTFDRIWPILYSTPLLTIFAVACALVIVIVVLDPASRLAMLLSARPLVFLGRISYSLYLWHVPILFAIGGTAVASPGAHEPARELAGIGLAFAAATTSYYLVERRFTRRSASRRNADLSAAPRPAPASALTSP